MSFGEQGVSTYPFSEMSCALRKESCYLEEVPEYHLQSHF